MTEKKRPEIKEIKKLTDSRFLNMYELDAVDRKGGGLFCGIPCQGNQGHEAVHQK